MQYIPDTKQYRFFNATIQGGGNPFIYFEVMADKSVIRAVYDETTVMDDDTLKATLDREKNKWKLRITGMTQNCPGVYGMTQIFIRSGSHVVHPMHVVYYQEHLALR